MKKYICISIAFAVLLGIIFFQQSRLAKTETDRDVYRNNTNVLLSDVKRYKTSDSLNVISVGNLELKLSEYKRYRYDDLKLIETLKVDNKRLSGIATTQLLSIYELSGMMQDSILFGPEKTDTLKCVTITDKWFDLIGCALPNNKFNGVFISRDSLLYVEHIIPHRFLFFKWGCKERKQDIISKNPNTQIIGAEYVTIRK